MAFYPGCPATFGGNMINNVLNAMQSFWCSFWRHSHLLFLLFLICSIHGQAGFFLVLFFPSGFACHFESTEKGYFVRR